jgi:glycosyltransferase involved in cell wall biosynthesis
VVLRPVGLPSGHHQPEADVREWTQTVPPEPVAVSVVVPVHNTEQYLEECLDSILAQSLPSIEVLCVDDGSTDGSGAILEDYAERDRRVQVLSYDGLPKGPGAARNIALDRATGEYVACVDSDDLLHPDMLSSLYADAKAADADVAMCLMVKFSDNDSTERYARCTYDRHIAPEFDGVTFDWRDLDVFRLRFASCNKIYRRSFLDQHRIRYSEGIFFEDMIFTYRALLLAKSLRLIREGLYLNRKEREGATTYVQSDRVYGALTAMDQVGTFLRSDPAYAHLLDDFAAFRFWKLTNYLHKNDAEHMGPFYDALQELARDPALVDNPWMTEELQQKREMLLQHDLLGYLVWEIWDMKTKYAASQRQRGRLKAQNRQLRSRSERFVLYRVEASLRRVLRPLVVWLRRWREAGGHGRALPSPSRPRRTDTEPAADGSRDR